MEIRVAVAELEVRAGEGDVALIKGRAAVYNSLSEDLGGFRERIHPGAFDDALAPGADVRSLWQHEAKFVLGRTLNGTLRLSTDEIGLLMEVNPPATSWAQDALVSLRRGDVTQMSFGFFVPKDGDKWHDENGLVVRDVYRVQLMEVSPVTFAAYPATSVEVRELVARLRAQQGQGDQGTSARARARTLELMEMVQKM